MGNSNQGETAFPFENGRIKVKVDGHEQNSSIKLKPGEKITGVATLDMANDDREGIFKVGIYGVCIQQNREWQRGHVEKTFLKYRSKEMNVKPTHSNDLLFQDKEDNHDLEFDIEIPLIEKLGSPTICEINKCGKLSFQHFLYAQFEPNGQNDYMVPEEQLLSPISYQKPLSIVLDPAKPSSQ